MESPTNTWEQNSFGSERSVDQKAVRAETDQKNQDSVEHKAQQYGKSKADEHMDWCYVQVLHAGTEVVQKRTDPTGPNG